MKRVWLIGPVLMVTIVSIGLALPTPGRAATDLTFAPDSYVTLTGGDGGQLVSALHGMESDNTPANSLMLSTPGKAYKGYRVFALPGDFDPAIITAIQVQANYRGPKRARQTWSWSIYNWSTRKWVRLGNNRSATQDVWSLLTFRVKGAASKLKNYVGPVNRQILVMVRSNNARYDAALDYEAVLVTTSQDVVIPAPPVWTPPPARPIWVPPPGTTWQWQLTQPVDTSYAVDMYDVDLFDTPQATINQLHADGRKVICYFSPGSYEKWRPDRQQFPAVVIGRKYVGWAGEYWLDIRQMGVLAPIMTARLDLAVDKGCDGVEPDNIHGYTEPTGFPLTAQDQIAYNTWLATEAHKRYLSIGLKNDLDQVGLFANIYDWALNEECYQFDECDTYHQFVDVNKAVFGAEYKGDPAVFCPQANDAQYSFIKKHLDLDAWMIPCTNY